MDENENEAEERQSRKIQIPKPSVSNLPSIAVAKAINEAFAKNGAMQ